MKAAEIFAAMRGIMFTYEDAPAAYTIVSLWDDYKGYHGTDGKVSARRLAILAKEIYEGW